MEEVRILFGTIAGKKLADVDYPVCYFNTLHFAEPNRERNWINFVLDAEIVRRYNNFKEGTQNGKFER